jgi:hypothetical protein
MKTKITIAILLLTVSVMARLPFNFVGWDRLKAESPEIIVADPGDPTPPTTGLLFENGPRFDFSITVLSVLKGTNGVRHARLLADHELRTREACLVFGSYDKGIYKADGDFRVVPLGMTFKQEMIAGKPLDEQIHILFQLAIDNLNMETAKEQAEIKRLETGMKGTFGSALEK